MGMKHRGLRFRFQQEYYENHGEPEIVTTSTGITSTIEIFTEALIAYCFSRFFRSMIEPNVTKINGTDCFINVAKPLV